MPHFFNHLKSKEHTNSLLQKNSVFFFIFICIFKSSLNLHFTSYLKPLILQILLHILSKFLHLYVRCPKVILGIFYHILLAFFLQVQGFTRAKFQQNLGKKQCKEPPRVITSKPIASKWSNPHSLSHFSLSKGAEIYVIVTSPRESVGLDSFIDFESYI